MAPVRKPAIAAKPAPAPVKAAAAPAKPVAAPAVSASAPAAVAKMEKTVEQAAEKALSGAKDAQEQFRKVVEQSVAQSRANYEKLKNVAETATGSLETSYQAASKGVSAINAKALEAFKAHSDATLEHLKAVMSAKTVADAIALQSAHARKQFEVFSAQAKELTTMAQKVAAEAGEPLKATFAKGFQN